MPTQSHADVTVTGLTEPNQNINRMSEDVGHMAAGHKANLKNQNTSEESKKKSAEALKKLGGEEAFYEKQGRGE
ncbi:conidiation-specific protein 6 [Curvularia clavata]|uniref:Conidiation-specific protein 6 n=1 Tax=Curvularia clavata TaxID=95742 RepID=A0A9Q8ZEJ1_CURCL|nr:conidiation-specific protein 6 [Curvularia clavata]